MSDIAGLQQLLDVRYFANWDTFVSPERVTASEVSVRRLVAKLIELGPEMSESAARAAVDACVDAFNELELEGWICTIEREDIIEQIGRVIDLCGFEFDEDWVSERDW